MKQPKKRRVVYLIPNILTTGNLFSGLASILFVFGGDYGAAAIAILVAIGLSGFASLTYNAHQFARNAGWFVDPGSIPFFR